MIQTLQMVARVGLGLIAVVALMGAANAANAGEMLPLEETVGPCLWPDTAARYALGDGPRSVQLIRSDNPRACRAACAVSYRMCTDAMKMSAHCIRRFSAHALRRNELQVCAIPDRTERRACRAEMRGGDAEFRMYVGESIDDARTLCDEYYAECRQGCEGELID